nr:hypothetical protein [Nitrospiraceae bacterium]
MQKGIIKLFIFITVLFVSGPCGASDTDLERDLQDKLRQSRGLLEKAGEKLESGNPAGVEISKLILLSEDIRA